MAAPAQRNMFRNIIGDPEVACDMVIASVFTHLHIDFAQALCCVSRHWRDLAQDPRWKPDLLLYSWGDGGCCGRETDDFIRLPRLLERFYSPSARDQIVQVACCDFVTLALSASGVVYRWGHLPEDRRQLLPERIPAFDGRRIADISVSCPGYYHARQQRRNRHHAAALADDGTFWMWGHNREAQLFLDSQDPATGKPRGAFVQEPEIVTCFAQRQEKVLRFSCGIKLTAVQTEDVQGRTRVYCAGNRLWDSDIWEVPELEGVQLRQLVCGGFYACAVDATGQLWTWGSPIGADHANGNLLGHGAEHYDEYLNAPRAPAKVVSSLPSPVRSVSTSSYSTLAICEDGRAFTWGDCDGDALGHRVTTCHEPVPVALPKGAAPVRAGSLAYTNGAVGTESGQLYMWGGRAWDQGISSGMREGRRAGGLPSEVSNSVAAGYRCENLVLGHNHAYIIARKLPKV